MKRIFVMAFAAVLLAESAWGSAEMIREKAKSIRDNNNQQQGVVSPAPTAPGTAAAPSGPQGMSASQQQLVDKLEADFSNLKTGTNASPDQKLALQTDMANLGKSTKPAKPLVTKLSTDLSVALAEKKLSAKDLGQLSKDINVVMNSAPIGSARAQTFVAEAQLILKTAEVSPAHAQAVGDDLKAIVLDIQKNKPKLY